MYGPATKNAAAAPRVMVAAMVLMRVMSATPSTSSLLTLTTLRSGAARGTGTRDRPGGTSVPSCSGSRTLGAGRAAAHSRHMDTAINDRVAWYFSLAPQAPSKHNTQPWRFTADD